MAITERYIVILITLYNNHVPQTVIVITFNNNHVPQTVPPLYNSRPGSSNGSLTGFPVESTSVKPVLSGGT